MSKDQMLVLDSATRRHLNRQSMDGRAEHSDGRLLSDILGLVLDLTSVRLKIFFSIPKTLKSEFMKFKFDFKK